MARAAQMTRVTIVSYNILAPTLCQADRLTATDPRHLDASLRFDKVLAKLEPAVKDGNIICLQEVSMMWGGKLHTWFQQQKYTFVATYYGSAFSDYMGVGIAYPRDAFREVEVNFKRISDVVARCRRSAREPPTWLQWAMKKVGWVEDALFSLVGKSPAKPPLNEWQAARQRYNRMVSLTLQHAGGGSEFTVSCYHMPCMFYAPKVMTLHAAWAAEHAFAVAAGRPLVLCGDFNLKPTDPGYEFLTTGAVSDPVGAPSYPEAPGSAWTAGCRSRPLVSAYARVKGAEPQFTNWAHEPGKDEFIDCLDYLFSTEDMKLESVVELPMRDEADGPFPSATEPSDHLLIGATYSLPAAETR